MAQVTYRGVQYDSEEYNARVLAEAARKQHQRIPTSHNGSHGNTRKQILSLGYEFLDRNLGFRVVATLYVTWVLP